MIKFTNAFLCGHFGKELTKDISSYKTRKGEIAELEKYDIYLSIRELLYQSGLGSRLFNGVKVNELNINTLDSYSLEDIKMIANTLEMIETLHNPNDDPNITLGRRR